MKPRTRLCLSTILIFCLSACSEKFSRSSQAAFKQPSTWAPLLAATIIAAADKDTKISEWAQDKTPVFGSMQDAVTASNNLVDSLVISAGVSALFIPDHSAESDLLPTNVEFFLIEGIGLSVNSGITSRLKSLAERNRPNQQDQRSFPSGHTSRAFSAANFSKHNIQQLNLTDDTKKYFDLVFDSAAIATGWARVEAGWHYPTDVLAGSALGNVVSSIIRDMYLNTTTNVIISVELLRDRQRLLFSYAF